MRNSKLLIINTLVLTLGGFMMRTISVSFNVYLTNRIGSSGMGLFQLIMTVYGLAVTFAGAGIKLGATRLVTDSLSTEDCEPRKIMTMCLKYALIVGSSVFMLLYMFSGFIGEHWICDIRAEKSLKILALSLPPISVSAALNGYFTARKNMLKFSGVQLAEQITRIIITLTALNFFGNTGLEYSCFAIGFGMTVSETLSAACSMILFIFDSRHIKSNDKHKSSLKKLLHISVPDAIGSGFRSVLLTVEHLLIPLGFKKSGQTAEQSMSIYGMIHGIALPVVLYPSAVITSLSSLLVPELARYKLFRDDKKISYISSSVLRLTLIFSIGVGCFVFFFAQTISDAIYKNGDSVFYIKLLSVLIPVMYCDTITDGLLKGLDCQAASMRYNIFDSALCVLLVYIILPKYAIMGYIFILFTSEIINFGLSINKLSKETVLMFNITDNIVKPLLCGLGCCSCVSLLFNSTSLFSLAPKPKFILLLTVSSVLYFVCIYVLESFGNSKIRSSINLFKNKSYS